jgi:hypothetical protein
MSAEQLAAIMAWATIYQWLAIASVFVFDSWRVHMRTARLLRTARAIGNGVVIIAEVRNRISWWYIIGSMLALALGFLGAYSASSLEAPPPDTRIVGAVIREGIVIMLFAFWRTKRGNVRLFRLMDQRRRDSEAKSETDEHLQESVDAGVEMAADTNMRIREMQQHGDTDRGEEQTERKEAKADRDESEIDRDEARPHRNPPEN